ncbi:hypothetical protein A3Q56_06127 [Intoshia linei]|uniref:Uncharacterized protein n=1 Tax=Intoshia linei TaxID=1819745 RepID=A0A177AVW3_9BILA|nr:hypothetical protein A3Q56_06127 [Intoshia linei]
MWSLLNMKHIPTDEDIVRIVNNNESVDDEKLFEEDNTVEVINVNEAFEGLSKYIDFAELNNSSMEDVVMLRRFREKLFKK